MTVRNVSTSRINPPIPRFNPQVCTCLLAPSSFNIGGKQYVVAQFPDGMYVLPTNAIPGVSTTSEGEEPHRRVVIIPSAES